MQLEVGKIMEGKVTGITQFGAFVDINDEVRGMVHISEVANVYVSQIKDHLTLGQDVKVKVLSVGDDGKISLSIKKAMEKPPVKKRTFENKPERKRNYTPQPPAPPVTSPGNYEWVAKKQESSSFEDMMSKFKQNSEEKISNLKKQEATTKRRKRVQ